MRSRRRAAVVVLGLMAVVTAGLMVGAYHLGPVQVWHALVGDAPPVDVLIVRDLRLPRLVIMASIGASLALAGTMLQAMLRNPLADASLLGLNAGASCATILLVVITNEAPWAMTAQRPVALLGGLLAAAALLVFQLRNRGSDPYRVLLAGLCLTIALTATTQLLLTVLSPTSASEVMRWLSGKLRFAGWDAATFAALSLVAAPLVWVLAPALEALELGDDPATTLGVPERRIRILALVTAAALASGASVLIGNIAFVGILAPHLARRLAPGHLRPRLLVAAVVGAGMMLASDLVARYALPDQALPTGVPLGIVAVPLFLWMYRQRP